MDKLQFKTNINCSSCIRSVTPFLDKADGIISWEVNTNDPDKILSIQTDRITAPEVMALVKKAGFNAEALNV